MIKADCEAVKKYSYVSNREFVCGLVEVTGNRIKLNIKSEFLTTSDSGFTGIIPLDPADNVASIDKMRAAAEYFAELANDLRQAIKLYQPDAVTPVEGEARPRTQQQQAEDLERIHSILEQLPEEEKAIYQGFGFSERARMYKTMGYDEDPVKMQTIICAKIRAISEKKG